ncbi:MAG TPA: LuxR C-terminal-related transcriptional regulator [Acidimicrobiales bacterium]|nr:LuxR C-terminal-related transcriptional regulator [Acidimicrobiales bacterium]
MFGRVESLQRLFEELGCRGYEARVLLALVRLGSATASELAGLADVARREIELLGVLASGRPYKEVAPEVGISVGTLKNHIYKIHRLCVYGSCTAM